MTAPSAALHTQLRPVIAAQWINFGLCVALLLVAFALRDNVPAAVWIRSTIILVVGLFMLLCGRQMGRGRRRGYVRAKWIAALGAIGFVGVAALPGPFPAWMRIEQGAQALVFLALAWMLTRPALASLFPRGEVRIDAAKAVPASAAGDRDASFDYLRAFIVLLVLLHHSVLAYARMWPEQSATFKILPAPIIDPERWAGFDLIAIFDDTFFMALMFLLSGLFVWPSLERKGAAKFLRHRLLRLGVPFAFAAGILAPLAYYPSYAVSGADPGFLGYAKAWLSLGSWPAGPAWFIWVLLVFDFAAAGLHALWRRRAAHAQAPRLLVLYDRPAVFVVALLMVSALVYAPLEWLFGAERWIALGPFTFQASRPLLYAAYFLVGVLLGACGAERGLLARDAVLARRWPIWLTAGLAAYILRLAVIIALVLPVAVAHQPLPPLTRLLTDLTLVLCCGALSFAFIAVFRRFAITHRPVLDSLSASSYGMYLFHYPIVVWLQFALLAVALGPIAKAAIVFAGAVALSWAITIALGRIPMLAHLL
jgi:peptidoglycan/LPS O-acetylase OafA/YrhL